MSKILKAKEVAELLRLSEATVLKLLAQGKLPGFKIGASWRLDMDELLKFIEKSRIEVQPKPKRERSVRRGGAHLTEKIPAAMNRQRISAA